MGWGGWSRKDSTSPFLFFSLLLSWQHNTAFRPLLLVNATGAGSSHQGNHFLHQAATPCAGSRPLQLIPVFFSPNNQPLCSAMLNILQHRSRVPSYFITDQHLRKHRPLEEQAVDEQGLAECCGNEHFWTPAVFFYLFRTPHSPTVVAIHGAWAGGASRSPPEGCKGDGIQLLKPFWLKGHDMPGYGPLTTAPA